MDNARTIPSADLWLSSTARQRLIPSDDLAEGRQVSFRAYWRPACVLALVLAVHVFVAGGLLLWPHQHLAGGVHATVAMVFEPPAPPTPLPDQTTPLEDVPPHSIAPPSVPQAESDLPSISLPRKLSTPQSSVAAPSIAPATARSMAAAAPVLAKPPAVAQPEGAEKLSCSPVHARYPAMARQLQEEGEALVQVVLDAAGQVVEAHLIRSTGYDDLDEQAVLTARSMRCTPPAHSPLTGRIPVGFHIQ